MLIVLPVLFLLFQLFVVFLLLIFISNCCFFFIFNIFPTNTVLLSLLIITIFFILSLRYVKNPIYILLSIVFSFILLSFLLFNINCELLTYTFIIVYLGALMLLFLFIVMLLNIQNMQKRTRTTIKNLVYNISFIGFFIFITQYVFMTMPIINSINNKNFASLFFYNEVCCNDVALLMLFQKRMIFSFLFIALLLLYVLISSITTIKAIK